ncbi:glucose 1-dehydrogenase [Arenibacter echinorum]|uniref:NAD(P)-dependent dehydrogenase (Short-subunit alcohol dehydrogenase family) n=1 Tax=Arenibacter echinorum TaxID=440515 RepID=A0A327RHV9_9FLAO|nr:glucose 1-dehydrogenase [Arenibacter echinorum]RAJ15755.1 NAD(P)-dependent dehydrogenase (short-subunit alcohol dehydrogenase family) [Arenibacter echinorum]
MQTRIKQKFDLKNKVAIVTGASKGIGESIARGLAEYGAKVVISSRSQEAVEHVANNFKKEGYDALGIGCHVGDEDQLKKLVEETVNAYGAVDILVNNAATNPFYGPLDTMENSLFDKIMDINTKAPFQLANLCYPIMKKRGGGSIINIASVEGMKPSVGLGLYSVSKAALIMLTKSQAVEWGKFGIRSNAICPGLIKTKFSSALWQNEKILDQVTRHLPAGRMAVPDEMAGLACFLASDASSYCTGSVFTADGGHMIAGGFN